MYCTRLVSQLHSLPISLSLSCPLPFESAARTKVETQRRREKSRVDSEPRSEEIGPRHTSSDAKLAPLRTSRTRFFFHLPAPFASLSFRGLIKFTFFDICSTLIFLFLVFLSFSGLQTMRPVIEAEQNKICRKNRARTTLSKSFSIYILSRQFFPKDPIRYFNFGTRVRVVRSYIRNTKLAEGLPDPVCPISWPDTVFIPLNYVDTSFFQMYIVFRDIELYESSANLFFALGKIAVTLF